MRVTPYQDINELLSYLSDNLSNILRENLIGFYLFGSLTYGDFNPASSDIDLVAIINKQLNHSKLEQAKHLHEEINQHYRKWRNRLECSYTPVDMLKNIFIRSCTHMTNDPSSFDKNNEMVKQAM